MVSDSHGPRRLHVPARLRGNTTGEVDPFAPPGGYLHVRAAGRPQVPSAFSPRSAANRAAQAVDGEAAPCPCTQDHDGGVCGAATGIPAARVYSRAAARLLRCQRCFNAGHFPGRPPRARSTDAPARRSSKAPVDPELAALDVQIARAAEQAKWDKAVATFDQSLPALFAKDLDEQLEPAVENRLERMRSGRGLHHLSLLCIGPYGSGKTWVSYSYARAAVRRRLLWPSQIIHGTEAEIMEPLWTGTFDSMRAHEQRLFNPRVRMILIDDVGNMGRYRSDGDRWRLFARLVNHAWANQLALVVSTNLRTGRDQALEHYIGVAAYERLRNMVGPDVVFRDRDRRAELTAQWEREYSESLSR